MHLHVFQLHISVGISSAGSAGRLSTVCLGWQWDFGSTRGLSVQWYSVCSLQNETQHFPGWWSAQSVRSGAVKARLSSGETQCPSSVQWLPLRGRSAAQGGAHPSVRRLEPGVCLHWWPLQSTWCTSSQPPGGLWELWAPGGKNKCNDRVWGDGVWSAVCDWKSSGGPRKDGRLGERWRRWEPAAWKRRPEARLLHYWNCLPRALEYAL